MNQQPEKQPVVAVLMGSHSDCHGSAGSSTGFPGCLAQFTPSCELAKPMQRRGPVQAYHIRQSARPTRMTATRSMPAAS